ncbi:MAG: helix-turn-helix transcriptional regulator [Taibaiella sp.]|nr:helix-turn-helix transcriptional regulator [Taibaiella sp.]
MLIKENIFDSISTYKIFEQDKNIGEDVPVVLGFQFQTTEMVKYLENLCNHYPLKPKIIFYFIPLAEATLKSLIKKSRIALINLSCTTPEIKSIIERLEVENIVLCTKTQHLLLKSITSEDIKEKQDIFTDMEKDILYTAKQGKSIRECAEILQLSHNTIAVYRSKMIKKAGVKNMVQLVNKYGYQRKLKDDFSENCI